jgi:hypothetical protein
VRGLKQPLVGDDGAQVEIDPPIIFFNFIARAQECIETSAITLHGDTFEAQQ